MVRRRRRKNGDRHTVRIQKRAECIEEPPMTVELLLVLLFEAKKDLDRASSLRYFSRLCDDHTGSISGQQ